MTGVVASEWRARFSGHLPFGNDETAPPSPASKATGSHAHTATGRRRLPRLSPPASRGLRSVRENKPNQKKAKATSEGEKARREIWESSGPHSPRCTTSASPSPTGSPCWPAACWATSAAAAPPPWRGAPAPARSSSSRASSASRPSRSAATPTSPSRSRRVRAPPAPPSHSLVLSFHLGTD